MKNCYIIILAMLMLSSCSDSSTSIEGNWDLVKLDTLDIEPGWIASFGESSKFSLNNEMFGTWMKNGDTLFVNFLSLSGDSIRKTINFKVQDDSLYLSEDIYRMKFEKYRTNSTYYKR